MKKRKIKYTNEPIGRVKIVPDFLPSPSELILKEETVKVTLALTKESVDFFKKEATLHHVGYQALIRALLASYVSHYQEH
ncbi:MAG TPA: CopG family transcriptional regulator [Gammaproteobacteria bacterium]|nr:CopG family transcriptional regulator [Gammaproteobacteria bacterium]